jgi:hypothetical protein
VRRLKLLMFVSFFKASQLKTCAGKYGRCSLSSNLIYSPPDMHRVVRFVAIVKYMEKYGYLGAGTSIRVFRQCARLIMSFSVSGGTCFLG